MDISVNLGENVTGIGYQFFDTTGLIGSRVTAGIDNPRTGVYYKAGVTPGSGAIGIYWDNTAGDVSASEVFETNAQPANVIQLLGTAWLTPAVAGTPDVNVKSFTASAITSGAFASGAVHSTALAAGAIRADVFASDAIGATALSSAAADKAADALLNRDMSAVTVTNTRSPINGFRALRNKWTISGGTYTVMKEDDSTTAWTSSVSTDAGALPLIGSDPA